GRATAGSSGRQAVLQPLRLTARGFQVSVVVSRSGSFDLSRPRRAPALFAVRPTEKAARSRRRSEKRCSITGRQRPVNRGRRWKRARPRFSAFQPVTLADEAVAGDPERRVDADDDQNAGFDGAVGMAGEAVAEAVDQIE